MRSIAGTLAAPFPYFGGKALACETVWCSPHCVGSASTAQAELFAV